MAYSIREFEEMMVLFDWRDIPDNYMVEINKDWQKYMDSIAPRSRIPTVGNCYELTLTIPDNNEKDYMINQFQVIVKSQMIKVADWVMAFELTKAGVLHLHSMLITTKPIQPSRIKKLYKYVFHLSKVGSMQNYLNYIQKEKDNVELLNYLKSINLNHIYRKPGCQIEFPKSVTPNMEEKSQ